MAKKDPLLTPVRRRDAVSMRESELISDRLKTSPTRNRRRGFVDFVLLGALASFAIGVFVWGSAVLSMASSINDAIKPPARAETETGPPAQVVIDCEALSQKQALWPEERRVLQEECGITRQAQQQSGPQLQGVPSQPHGQGGAGEPAEGNRADCNQIRGTPYRSGEERDWFFVNCLNRPAPGGGSNQNALAQQQGNQAQPQPNQNAPNQAQAQPPSPFGQPQPNRANCGAISGTPYLSEAERVWFITNCLNQQPQPSAPQNQALAQPQQQVPPQPAPQQPAPQQQVPQQPAPQQQVPQQPAPQPQAQVETGNRMDCNAIRGTPYRSPEEYVWYLNNCRR